MNKNKAFEKFRHYWLLEDEFRGLLYQGHTNRNLTFEFDREQITKLRSSLYGDFFNIWYCWCAANSLADFLTGLVGREVSSLPTKLFYDWGHSLSLDDKVIFFWNQILERSDLQDWLFNLDKNAQGYFLSGRSDALEGRRARVEILFDSPSEQSLYLLGRDSILNLNHIRSFLS